MAMRSPLARAPLLEANVITWRERDAASAASWLKSVIDSPLAEELVEDQAG